MQDTVTKMTEFFKALNDPTRLKVMRILASNPENKLCVGAIAQRLGVTQPAVSQHLKVLKNVGFVEPNREGYWVHYSINLEVLTDFRNGVEELCQLALNHDSCEKECQNHHK